MMAHLFGLLGPREVYGMRQHDPTELYLLGVVHRLLEVKPGHLASEYREIFTQVSFVLGQFRKNEFNRTFLPNTVEAADRLRNWTRVLTSPEPDAELEETLVENLLGGFISHFESALAIDFKALPLFLIEDKRGYSSREFLRDASVIFSKADITSMAPLTLNDIAEAGRCLLLDRHTAAGFHTMRALEAVARGYYRMAFNAEPVNTNNGLPLGLGAIADYLRKYKNKRESTNESTGSLGDIIPTLDWIASVYRNNIMHPEMTLDEDLAVDVFDHAKSAITSMLRDLRKGGPHLKVALATYDFSWAWKLAD
jgi:hypothetical protein